MEGGGSANKSSCVMAFGEHNNEPSSMMMMMMPLVSYNHHSHPEADSSSNTLFLPLPPPNHDPNRSSSDGGSCMILGDHHHHGHGHQNTSGVNPSSNGSYFMENDGSSGNVASAKAKIMAHPHYLRLLAAYVSCQKIGAPPEVVAKLEEACASAARIDSSYTSSIGEDPALDQFMEAYCEMLSKYEQELSKPLKEAMLFLQKVESQFKSLTVSSPNSGCGEANERNGSSEEDVDVNNFIDPQAEDQELKGQLLRRYSGYLGSLKQEFMKKRKKGKLPKEARQQLLDWWSRHYKWPYPSESQKLALAESTGLDQKQINNWFINQRKRHWKPSEDMQLVVMDAAHPHYYMDNILGNPFPMDISPSLL